MTRAHWSDVGGMSTGFGARGPGVDPWLEGLQLDQLKLIDEGVYDEKLLQLISDNIRFPNAALGDMRAQFAACRAAEQRLTELVERYGRDGVDTAIEEVFDSSETRCRAVVEGMADGVYRATSRLDHDFSPGAVPLEIAVEVTIEGSSMTIDLTGCSTQRDSVINARTLAGAYVAYKALTTPLEPVNEGSFRALTVDINEGNFMMAKFPAPMASWSVALPTVVDTVITALAPARPAQIPAAHFGTLGGSFAFFGKDAQRGSFVAQGIEGGGWGGRPTEDGASASVSVCQGDVRNSPVEALELRFPMRVEKRSLREDSGGAGKYRGGLGQLTEIRNLVPGSWRLSMAGRHLCPPWGLWGGEAGPPGGHALQRAGDRRVRAGQRPARRARRLGGAHLHRRWRRLGLAPRASARSRGGGRDRRLRQRRSPPWSTTASCSTTTVPWTSRPASAAAASWSPSPSRAACDCLCGGLGPAGRRRGRGVRRPGRQGRGRHA